MSAELIYAHGMKHQIYSELDAARNLYPYLRYIAQGPARTGSLKDIMRAVREDPRAFDLAEALNSLQPRR